MIRRIFRFYGKCLTIAATGFFIAGFVAVGAACFLLTWPFIWGRPIKRRTRATVELVTAIMAFISTMPAPGDFRQVVNVAASVADALPDDTPNDT